jgi:PAS domain S-box-containing protein
VTVPPQEQAPTVLVVDDEDATRYAVTKMLAGAGFAVREASTGTDALARTPGCDVVVLDVQLPDMNGFEVCRLIKGDSSTRAIPVLMLSATYQTSEYRTQGLTSGADAYLTHPAEPPELIAWVRALLRIRQVERYLRQSAREWQTTFDAISDAVCLLDPAGTIIRCNRALVLVSGRTFQDLIGADAGTLLHELFGTVTPELGSGQGEGPSLSEARRGDRLFELTLDPVRDESEQPSGSVLTISDVTERRRQEEDERRANLRDEENTRLREHADRMAALEHMKSDFLRLTSHELRTPLAVLRGYVSMMGDGTFGPLPANLKRVVPTLAAKLFQMNLLINQMLETARLEEARPQLNLRPVDLVQAVHEAVQTVQPFARPEQQLVFEADHSSVWVKVDPVRLGTIITNLLDNAIKFSPEGGDVECHVTASGGFGELRVQDLGIGISAADIPRLFGRFSRVIGSEHSEIPGTGLGLYIARELARLHGGDIAVQSVAGAGSTFTLRLPQVEPAGEAATAAEDVTSGGKSHRDPTKSRSMS